MDKFLLKTLSLIFLFLSTEAAVAETVVPVKENENVSIQVSRDNYNRLLVEKDKITRLRFPQKHLSVERDEDGSVYLDVLDDRPFTIFVTTQGGRHFSALVSVAESAGETIRFIEKGASQKVLSRKARPRDLYAEKIKSLIASTEREEKLKGYQANTTKVRSVYLKPSLKAELVWSLSDKNMVSQKFHLINRSSKPISFDESWFKVKATRALMVKNNVIYPNQTVDVVRVLEVAHG